MKASHVLGNNLSSGIVPDTSSFMLADRKGGFLHLASAPLSRYNGWFCKKNGRTLKIIDSISLINSPAPSQLVNKFSCFERKRAKLTERFFLTPDSFVYELNEPYLMRLDFDVKEAYDSRQWGREYKISIEKDYVLISFSKKTSSIEDLSDGTLEFSLFIAIRHDGTFKPLNNWSSRDYCADKDRKSIPFSRYVFEAVEGVAKKVVFSVSDNRESAIKEANRIYANSGKLMERQKFQLNGSFAYACALKSLEGLYSKEGLYAGLPWFFQYWSRDEAVCAKALSRAVGSVKELLLERLANSSSDGRTSNIMGENYKNSPSGCADGIGWLALRIRELKLSADEKKFVADKLEEAVSNIRKNYERDGLIYNHPLETWMDTSAGNDTREGFRVEIQFFQLALYNMLYSLTGKKEYAEIERVMAQKVRASFWNGKILADGLNDFTQRPNVFIAAYAYPQLLSREEWSTCFNNILQSIWLEWGGLATIERKSPLFRLEYSGELPESYHRGDSWFWLNNLAAIVMHRIDKKAFGSCIKKIFEASERDILWSGSIGNHSELSSAKEQRAEGSLNQAWSSAMFIELYDELNS